MNELKWRELFEAQKALYPRAELQDLVKALHQSALGCGHLLQDEGMARALLAREWQEDGPEPGEAVEALSGGFSRLHLGAARRDGLSEETAWQMFRLSARIRTGRERDFLSALQKVQAAFPGGNGFWDAYLPLVPGMVRHSEAFRAAYRPAYRVISDDLAQLYPLFSRIDRELSARRFLTVGVDGPCASGKSALADTLKTLYGAQIVHLDDFFPQAFQRTEERLAEPGGNLDRERFLSEAGPGLTAGGAFFYRRFDCAAMALGETVRVPKARLYVAEGSYAMHPALRHLYGLSVFVTADLDTRLQRIRRRNGEEGLRRFLDRWIPLEDRYFAACGVEQACGLTLRLSDTPYRAGRGEDA